MPKALPRPTRRGGRIFPCRGAAGLVAALLMVPMTFARADRFSDRDPFFKQLSIPMTSIVDGKPFREALTGIADEARINLWIDRHVDPTSPVVAGPVGPTVYAAITKIAAQRDCVVMPVKNVLLVGRPEWVDQAASSVLGLQLDDGRAAVADIGWEDLTAPGEALQQAAALGAGEVDVTPELPHDLWPANKWKKIDRRVAATLVLAQFDLRPKTTTSITEIETVAASNAILTRTYAINQPADAIRKLSDAMTAADRNVQIRAEKDSLTARGDVVAHRAAIKAMFELTENNAGPDPEKDTFTLKRMTTSAENALRQLAGTARKTCVIEPDAAQACRQNVSIEGQDLTLRELIDMVAKQADVTATWQDDTIVISAKK